MTTLRRLSLLALVLGFGHVVFGAVVRITGSGLGCGNHWPKCHGYWFPPLERSDLIIEVSHRYFAAGLSLAIVALLAAAVLKRHEPGVTGKGGLLRPSAAAAVLVVAAALFGAATVKYELANKWVIVVHLAIAMTLLGVLVAAAMRAGAFGGSIEPGSASARTWRAARAALSMAFAVLILGSLTAHLPGANSACQGFPLCRGSLLPTGPQLTQFVHRILAYLLFFHLLGSMLAVRRRGENAVVIRASRLAFGLAVTQLVVAATMVEMHLPAFWRALHQATGTALWIAIVAFALLARRGSEGQAAAVGVPAPRPILAATEVGA